MVCVSITLCDGRVVATFFVFSSFRLLGTATIVVGVNSYSKLWKKWEFITYTLGRSFISFLLSLSQR